MKTKRTAKANRKVDPPRWSVHTEYTPDGCNTLTAGQLFRSTAVTGRLRFVRYVVADGGDNGEWVDCYPVTMQGKVKSGLRSIAANTITKVHNR